jgi:hypothetical protein
MPARLPMHLLTLTVLRLYLRIRGTERDRGDVPGWVLVTVMTAGLVTALLAFAVPRLVEILGTALDSVTGP